MRCWCAVGKGWGQASLPGSLHQLNGVHGPGEPDQHLGSRPEILEPSGLRTLAGTNCLSGAADCCSWNVAQASQIPSFSGGGYTHSWERAERVSSLHVGVGRTQSLAPGRCHPLGAACLPETLCPEAYEEAAVLPLRGGERGEFACQPLATGNPLSRAVTRKVAKKAQRPARARVPYREGL